jgi:tRNA dimethylallyltransferase
MPHDFSNALVLTGPTGSGKTAVSLELAAVLDAEIIAMDSMTLYRGMDIGTAKPTPAEQARVRHHLIDVLEPHESANVAWWLAKAAQACEDIARRGKRPLFVGGTPFYLSSLLHGLFDSPKIQPEIRECLEDEATRIGAAAFHARLAAVDPVAASSIHPNNVRRVVRALEVYEATGTPISQLQQSWVAPPTPIPAVWLEWPREVLYERIDRRVVAMIAAGWENECSRLLSKPIGKEASNAIGYQDMMTHLKKDGRELGVPVNDFVTIIQQQTRNFAKRQLTWFRSLPLTPVEAGAPDLIPRILMAWRTPLEPPAKS